MKKLIENTAYWIGILTLGIVVGVTIKMVSAWVEPDQMPPGGNIAAPLNTGNVGQSKQGGLTLNIGGATYGLIVDKGLAGIGTTTPGEKLEVNGNVKLSGEQPSFKMTNVALPTASADVATKGYVDGLLGQGSSCVATASCDSLTANGGMYGNKIIDMVPPNAFTEICIKNGNIYYDKHEGSGTTRGENCVPGDIGWIIEKNERPAATWEEAKMNCTKPNMRLPEPFEWKFACKNAELSSMTGNREWASNTAMPLYTNVGWGVGAPLMGNSSCADMTVRWIATEYTAAPDGKEASMAYRCAR